MVTCEFKGRLANYLFQIAATMGLAEKYGDVAEFDDYVNSEEFKNHYTAGVEIENIYEENGHGYQEIPYSPNLCLKGFWQSEKYFSHIREKLQNTFRIPDETIPGTIALHYRRGDFYLYPDLFPILPKEYFFNALSKLLLIIGSHFRKVIVFSDEIETCKNLFREYDFEYSENKTPLEDFYAMCQCEYFIISNSAYSWMAAWLSRSQKKVVICPEESKWYGKNANMDTKDLLPESWIKI